MKNNFTLKIGVLARATPWKKWAKAPLRVWDDKNLEEKQSLVI